MIMISTKISLWKSYLITINALLQRDFILFQKSFLTKFIDSAIMVSLNALIFGYIMPRMGLESNYGSFLLIGTIASFGFFEIIGKVSIFLADIEHNLIFSYMLMPPIPTSLTFCYLAFSWALSSAIIALIFIPLGKLFLFNQFSFSTIAWGKFICLFIISNLFFGFFALFLSGILKNMSSISSLFIRIINPLYGLGCFFYTWTTVNSFIPILSYIMLLNPITYVMEGTRVAMLGQQGFISFWYSFGALCCFTFLFAVFGIIKLKKKLDCL